MKLFLALCALLGVNCQSCSCTPTRVVQKVWGDSDVMFFGNIALSNGRMQATVSIPLKGCLSPNQKVQLSSDGPCAITPPTGKGAQSWLVSGMAVGGKVVVDTCGWTRLRSQVEIQDTLWLMNQFEKCPDQALTCPNQRPALTCDRSVCDMSACAGTTTCETNPCHNCAVQYLNSDNKLKCGELGGSEYETRLCPTCTVDPCLNRTAQDLAGSCPEWKNAVKCLARPCSTCKDPIWLDADGREVCPSKSNALQCANLGGVRFSGSCTSSVLGYANIKNDLCVPVSGCLPLPPNITLFKTVEECRGSCVCEDFSKVNMSYSASNPECNLSLGWGLVGNKCEIVKGCKAFMASPIGASLYSDKELCEASCASLQKGYAIVNGRPMGWNEEVQGPKSVPQYAKVFPRNAVNRMDIKFEPEEYARMQEDLKGIMNDYIQEAQRSGAMGSVMGRRLLQFGGGRNRNGGGGGGRRGGGGGGGGNAQNDLIRQILLQRLMGTSGASMDPIAAFLGQTQQLGAKASSAAPKAATSAASSMDPATQQAIAKMFAGVALPDGTCKPACGSGGACPARRDVSKTNFGFNERGVKLSKDPDFGRATVTFQGHTWQNVGIRYKGGNSLQGSFFLQSQMIGFRMSMSTFDKEYPEIKNQKLFGFSKLTFSNNWMEKSHIREVLSYEILGASGVKAPRATPVRIYFDIGDGKGLTFWGLYTMIEDPSDVIVTTFPNDPTPGDGNIYKPENNTWERFVAEDFEKKNNDKKNMSFADIQGAIAALQAPTRRTNPAVWRRNLEAVFDVPTFLKSLGAVSLIGNWDTYGKMPHNYYLYNVGGQLKWIPWDFNLALNCDDRLQSIFKNEIGNEWPLISYLLADPVYRNDYTTFVQWLITSGPFEINNLVTRKNQLMELVTPHVMGLADPKNASLIYEPEAPPHTTMYDPSTFPQEFAKLERYLRQRVEIATYELNVEARRG